MRGEPDPLDDKLPEAEASQQTPKFTIHIEICPADDVTSDAEELNAYDWAKAASIADAATRASHMLAQPGGGGSTTATTVPTWNCNYFCRSVWADTVPAVGGSEEGSPHDVKQVNRPVIVLRQTVLSVRPCLSNSLQAVLPKRLSEVSERCTVSGAALSSPAHDLRSNVVSAVSPNLDSALGAVLDDDEVRACKGTDEDEGNLLASHQHNIRLGNLLASHQHNFPISASSCDAANLLGSFATSSSDVCLPVDSGSSCVLDCQASFEKLCSLQECRDSVIFKCPLQEVEISKVSHLGPPCGVAIGVEDGATEIPGWLTRQFHPPEWITNLGKSLSVVDLRLGSKKSLRQDHAAVHTEGSGGGPDPPKMTSAPLQSGQKVSSDYKVPDNIFAPADRALYAFDAALRASTIQTKPQSAYPAIQVVHSASSEQDKKAKAHPPKVPPAHVRSGQNKSKHNISNNTFAPAERASY